MNASPLAHCQACGRTHSQPIDFSRDLRRVQEEIDAFAGGSRVHSLQVVTAADNSLRSPISFTWSRDSVLYNGAIESFTGLRNERHFGNSLVGEDPTEPFYYSELGDGDITSDAPFAFRKDGPWTYQPPKEPDTFGQKVNSWREALAKSFSNRGSTMFVAQRHDVASNDKMISCAFLVMSRTIPGEHHYLIAKKLRDLLVSLLIKRYSNDAQISVSELYQSVMNLDITKKAGNAIRQQLKNMAAAVVSSCPMTITGESGTGKLQAAHLIYQMREEHFRTHGPDWRRDIRANGPRALDVAQLRSLSMKDVLQAIREAQGFSTGDSNALDRERHQGIVVYDNIHEADRTTQLALLHALEDSLSFQGREPRPELVMRKPVFISLPGIDASANSGRFDSSLFALMSPFTLECPPLRDRRSELHEVIPHVVTSLAHALCMDPPSIPPKELEQLCTRRWAGNFRELQVEIIRRICASSVDAQTGVGNGV